eukprot:TRINITY_DN1001_c0_g1_i1.p1 TRINITY_DN1001_c0_g1~~TRINITY_DN1001_c0_g1_i1.p1  ORF type:complete len:537 (+),score=178.44 TRINITY_DN1001_c0_g1_i1:117-1727(+)
MSIYVGTDTGLVKVLAEDSESRLRVVATWGEAQHRSLGVTHLEFVPTPPAYRSEDELGSRELVSVARACGRVEIMDLQTGFTHWRLDSLPNILAPHFTPLVEHGLDKYEMVSCGPCGTLIVTKTPPLCKSAPTRLPDFLIPSVKKGAGGKGADADAAEGDHDTANEAGTSTAGGGGEDTIGSGEDINGSGEDTNGSAAEQISPEHLQPQAISSHKVFDNPNVQAEATVLRVHRGSSLSYAGAPQDTPAASGEACVALVGCKEAATRLWDVNASKEVWRAKNLKVTKLLLAHKFWDRDACFVPDGKQTFFTATSYRQIRFFDPSAQRRAVWYEEVGENPFTSIAMSPDANYVLTTDTLGNVCKFDVRKRAMIASYKGRITGSTRQAAVSADSEQVCAVGLDRTVRVWRYEDRKLLHSVYVKQRLNRCLFSPTNILLKAAHQRRRERAEGAAEGERELLLNEEEVAATRPSTVVPPSQRSAEIDDILGQLPAVSTADKRKNKNKSKKTKKGDVVGKRTREEEEAAPDAGESKRRRKRS